MVSILIFLDSPATEAPYIITRKTDFCFNPYFPGLSCNLSYVLFLLWFICFSFQSLFSWTLLQLQMGEVGAGMEDGFQSLFSWTLLQLSESFCKIFLSLVSSFNPYFPGLSCNYNTRCIGKMAEVVSILIFLDSPATWSTPEKMLEWWQEVSILIFLDSPATCVFQPRRAWTPRVSILIFLDSPATPKKNLLTFIFFLFSFNPYFPGLSCNPAIKSLREEGIIKFQSLFSWTLLQPPLKILLHSHFLVCSHPIYIFRYAWLLMIKKIPIYIIGAHQPNIIWQYVL